MPYKTVNRPPFSAGNGANGFPARLLGENLYRLVESRTIKETKAQAFLPNRRKLNLTASADKDANAVSWGNH